MRISDWSSDVCSSDLTGHAVECGLFTFCLIEHIHHIDFCLVVVLDRTGGGTRTHKLSIETQDSRDALFRLQRRNQVDDGLATRIAATLRQLEHTQPVHLANAREEQQSTVGAGTKQGIDLNFIFYMIGRQIERK